MQRFQENFQMKGRTDLNSKDSYSDRWGSNKGKSQLRNINVDKNNKIQCNSVEHTSLPWPNNNMALKRTLGLYCILALPK